MKILKKTIEIFRKIIVGYIFYTFLLTVIAIILVPKPPGTGSDEEIMNYVNNVIFNNTFNSIAMAQIMVWHLVSLFYSVSMLFSRNNREIFIKKLSGVKERDEREVQIVGKALRASYLTTMAILVVLLFISMVHIEVSKMSADRVEPGEPRGWAGLAVGFETLVPDALITQKEGYDVYFESHGLPLSMTIVILILLVWQIVSFRFVIRRAMKVPE